METYMYSVTDADNFSIGKESNDDNYLPIDNDPPVPPHGIL